MKTIQIIQRIQKVGFLLSFLWLAGLVLPNTLLAQATRADPYASGVVPQVDPIRQCEYAEVWFSVGNAVGSSRAIAPNTVNWLINFPYDIIGIDVPILPAPFA